MSQGAKALRKYCNSIEYPKLYRFLSGLNYYYQNPYAIHSHNSIHAHLEDLLDDPISPLIDLLLFLTDISYDNLTKEERLLVHLLADENFVTIEDDKVCSLGYQLICYDDFYILIDGYINFKSKGIHRSYIGIDTYVMLYYLYPRGTGSLLRGLDLCTGSGIGALRLSRYCDQVIATDIAPFPLKLAAFNISINQLEDSITLREEAFLDTLEDHSPYDYITCNPPFVAFPDELEAPIYAKGFDTDGLSFYRQFLRKSSYLLTDTGMAYFVGDFIGDAYMPYFYEELKTYANEQGLAIDMIIDNKLDAKKQLEVYPKLLKRFNPDKSMEELDTLSHTLIQGALKAKYYYLTTLTIQKCKKPRIRCFNRYKRSPHYVEIFGDHL